MHSQGDIEEGRAETNCVIVSYLKQLAYFVNTRRGKNTFFYFIRLTCDEMSESFSGSCP